MACSLRGAGVLGSRIRNPPQPVLRVKISPGAAAG